ncbi:MAG: MBL fold metallo-hydrolase [Anaerolineae bacterium]|nr:MBL fold metallo-hydrolase [Anaerolineae bacterium]
MIEPIQKDAALLDDIRSTQPEPGQIAVWWLGQSGYAFKTISATWWIDLYLSEHLTLKYAQTDKPHIRMTESPLRGHEITDAAWVFASHRHSDHLDPGTLPDLMRASPDARLVLPLAAVDHAVGLGLPRERLIPTRGEETFSVGPLTVHSIPSAHPEFEYSGDKGYPFLGYIFEVDGLRIYHSGDTLAYDGLAERLSGHALDLAFLPINGAGIPGTPGNMNSAEAVALAGQVHPRLVVPCHYDLFSFNTADVAAFARLAEDAHIPYKVLRPGEKWLWSRA